MSLTDRGAAIAGLLFVALLAYPPILYWKDGYDRAAAEAKRQEELKAAAEQAERERIAAIKKAEEEARQAQAKKELMASIAKSEAEAKDLLPKVESSDLLIQKAESAAKIEQDKVERLVKAQKDRMAAAEAARQQADLAKAQAEINAREKEQQKKLEEALRRADAENASRIKTAQQLLDERRAVQQRAQAEHADAVRRSQEEMRRGIMWGR